MVEHSTAAADQVGGVEMPHRGLWLPGIVERLAKSEVQPLELRPAQTSRRGLALHLLDPPRVARSELPRLCQTQPQAAAGGVDPDRLFIRGGCLVEPSGPRERVAQSPDRLAVGRVARYDTAQQSLGV